METELKSHQHRFFVQFPFKYRLLFFNGVGCLNLDYWHKQSDKRFLLLGYVIYPVWPTNSTYCPEAPGISDVSADTQMGRVGTCNTNVSNIILAGVETWKPLMSTLQSLCLSPLALLPSGAPLVPHHSQEQISWGSKIFPFLDCGHALCVKFLFTLGKISCTEQWLHKLRDAVICQEQTLILFHKAMELLSTKGR